LGAILLAAHLIDDPTLARVRKECQRTSRPLWRLLTRDGAVSEDAIFKTLRQEVHVPVLAEDQLKSVVMPADLRKALPHAVAQHLGILPLERSTDGRRAVLAMVDPTDDITPLWPALTKLGVIEIRRFLLHIGTLRLGLEFFYGTPWQQDSDDPDEEAATVQAVQALLSGPVAQPPQPHPSRPGVHDSSVMIDPALQKELAQLDGPTDPNARTQPLRIKQEMIHAQPSAGPASSPALTPAAASISAPSVAPIAAPVAASITAPIAIPALASITASITGPIVVPIVASAAAQIAAPVAVPVGGAPAAAAVPVLVGKREISLLELQASDVLMLEESSLQFERPAMLSETEPVQDALLLASEALISAIETELHTKRPESLARLAQAVAERLNFAPRAVRELILITRLYGLLRLCLLRDGALPAPRKDILGFEVKHPLMTALSALQGVLVDFIRLPTEPDLVPMGPRIVSALVGALDLIEKSADPTSEELPAALRAELGDNEVTTALTQIIETDLQALGIAADKPEAEPIQAPTATVKPAQAPQPAPAAAPEPPPTPAPSVHFLSPKPPVMPGVRWRTGLAASMSAEGLEPYTLPS
jgi:hypothetical protein